MAGGDFAPLKVSMDPNLERASLVDSVYASPGWQQVFQPLMEEKYRMYEVALRNPDIARKAKMPDDFIRGALATLEWIMTTPRLNAEIDRNTGVEEILQQKREEKDNRMASLGFGMGGSYMPEDFS